jgi:NTE family protein
MADDARNLAESGAARSRPAALPRPNFECIALLLQGGGALGAYQAGVYEALAEVGLHPDWVAGISIGAINSAIIAGNPPHERVPQLRRFWEQVTSHWISPLDRNSPFVRGEAPRKAINQASAAAALFQGAPGFFVPRVPGPWFFPDGSFEATSWYDTKKLRATLESAIDFDRINNGGIHLSLGAVNVCTGNFVYFDTETQAIGPEHVMASGALPPGFPAIEIEGEHYWDGGLVSNTPLQWVLESPERRDTLAFQVDLWNARGDFPSNLAEVATRQKEITYSSRTREQTDRFRRTQMLRHAFAKLLPNLPPELRETEEAKLLAEQADHKVYSIVHLIYRAQHYEGYSKDYEFSRLSMEEHWRSGYNDTRRTLMHPEALVRPSNPEGLSIYDFARDGRL